MYEMSQENIVKYVSPTEILTDTEIVLILKKINGMDVVGLKWTEREKRVSAGLTLKMSNRMTVLGITKEDLMANFRHVTFFPRQMHFKQNCAGIRFFALDTTKCDV